MFSHQDTIESVVQWLSDFGIDISRIKHSNRGWISFQLTTEEAESKLHKEYHLFESDDGQIIPAYVRFEPSLPRYHRSTVIMSQVIFKHMLIARLIPLPIATVFFT